MSDKLMQLISLHEGRCAHAYQDSLGFLTIGVGHLIDSRRGGKISEAAIDLLLDSDIRDVTNQIDLALPWAATLDPVRLAVLMDMCFNLGIVNLLGFKHFLISLQTRDYKIASEQMLQSKWAEQVKTRAIRLSKMIETGGWPPELA